MKLALILLILIFLFTGCTDTAVSEPIELNVLSIGKIEPISVDEQLLNEYGFFDDPRFIIKFYAVCYNVKLSEPPSEYKGYSLRNLETELVSGERLQSMSAPSINDAAAGVSMTVTDKIPAYFEYVDVVDPQIIGELLGFMPESYISVNETIEYEITPDIPRVSIYTYPLYKRYSFEVYKNDKFIERGYANLPYGVAFIVSPTLTLIPQ
ncbi:MAG: hypothetical protein HFE63_02845 [Clostridiales bacterium]|nr:hypothetical protein [Clostridiales bacterium]